MFTHDRTYNLDYVSNKLDYVSNILQPSTIEKALQSFKREA